MGNAITGIALCLFLFTPLLTFGDDNGKDPASRKPTAILKAYASMDNSLIPECSGIIKSLRYSNIFWTHSDSGNPPAIYPITGDGTLISIGVELPAGENIDWEDITADDKGNLIMADTGNNRYNRDNLSVLLFPEPDAYIESSVADVTRVRFRYPETKPGKTKSYDSEALFFYGGSLYLLTKHFAGFSRLYRFPCLTQGKEHVLTFIRRLNTGGMVTAADADENRGKLAVLTYSSVGIFDMDEVLGGTEDYSGGFYLPIGAGQCEALCFSGDLLLIANEGGEIFKIPLK